MKVSYTKLFEKGFPSYHDEPLKGKLKGNRSARMSRSYRLIYCELVEGVHLKLIEVHKHDY